MSILDLETLTERKEFIAEQLLELGCDEWLEALTDKDLANVSETMVNIVRLMEENEDGADIDEKINFLLNYILVLWAEMIVDGGKDSRLL
jgi:hypothetical protein